jgi:hypothetical protein
MQMETVINQDFSFCNHFILTNRHNPEIIDFVSDYTHNLDFLQVSLRNTWFHVITKGKIQTQNGTMGLKQFETDN